MGCVELYITVNKCVYCWFWHETRSHKSPSVCKFLEQGAGVRTYFSIWFDLTMSVWPRSACLSLWALLCVWAPCFSKAIATFSQNSHTELLNNREGGSQQSQAQTYTLGLECSNKHITIFSLINYSFHKII